MICNRLGCRKILFVRINLFSPNPKPVAYMVACCKPCAAHITNYITLAHPLPYIDISFGHVQVLGGVSIIVLHLHVIPVSCSITRGDHSTICSTPDGSAMRCSIICSFMSFP